MKTRHCRCQGRSPAPFILASWLSSYPAESLRTEIADVLKESSINFACAEVTSISLWERVRAQLTDITSSAEKYAELASRYIDLFDRGSIVNSLYETEYGLRRSQLKTGELADIAGFYRAFGFQLAESSEAREMLDHLAVECEFYALLLAKQEFLAENGNTEAVEVVLDARKKFLQDHLGRYVSAVAGRPAVVDDPFYSVAFKWCADLVDDECEELAVAVVPVDYQCSSDQDEEVNCGACPDIVSKIGSSRAI